MAQQRKLDKQKGTGHTRMAATTILQEAIHLQERHTANADNSHLEADNLKRLLSDLRQSRRDSGVNDQPGFSESFVSAPDPTTQRKSLFQIPSAISEIKPAVIELLPSTSVTIDQEKFNALLALLKDGAPAANSESFKTPAEQVIVHPEMSSSSIHHRSSSNPRPDSSNASPFLSLSAPVNEPTEQA